MDIETVHKLYGPKAFEPIKPIEDEPAPDASDEEWRAWARKDADLAIREVMRDAVMVEIVGARTLIEKIPEHARRLEESMRRMEEAVRRAVE